MKRVVDRCQVVCMAVVLLTLASSLTGCPSSTPTTLPEIASFAINNGAASTTSVTVTLNNVCSGSPTQYMASESADFSGASWQTYAAAPSFTLFSSTGAKTVYFKVKNDQGESTTATDTITLDEQATDTLAVTSFTINNGAASTTSDTVTLNNVCSGSPTQYMASESADFSGANWQTYAAAPSFTLSSSTGAKTVYFKVKNDQAESTAANDTITLDENIVSGTEETIMLPGNVPLTMVWCPAGTFMMGRYPGEQDSFPEEDPQHQVTLTLGFWMGKYELTKAQWTAVMGTTPWSGQDLVLNDPASPAVYVSWNDAQAFITALNSYTGLTFRLPSEAQWEYAARAGTTTRFYWGDDPSYSQIGNYAWHWGNCSGQQYAHIVGQKLPNGFGLYDMSGNAWEWCQDWYGNYTEGAVTNPTGPATDSSRVTRGGSWAVFDYNCRSAIRGIFYPTDVYDDFGFRIAR